MKWVITSMLVFFLGVPMTNANKTGPVHQFEALRNDGTPQPLSAYQGRALLIVNTASRCGYTPQYKGLQALHEKYAGKGLSVLAFPSNDFGRQEPGTNAEIREFCSLRYGVEFDLFSKIQVKGKEQHPLYRYLTEESPFPGGIRWNFNKFLVNPEGEVVARFGSGDDPLDPAVIRQIEAVLPSSTAR